MAVIVEGGQTHSFLLKDVNVHAIFLYFRHTLQAEVTAVNMPQLCLISQSQTLSQSDCVLFNMASSESK